MIVALDEIPRAAEPCDRSLDWRPVRDHLGISAFGVNAFLGAAPGDRVVERHDEGAQGHEELYVVVRGAARFVIDDAEHEVPAGSVVLVAPGSMREAFATAPDRRRCSSSAARPARRLPFPPGRRASSSSAGAPRSPPGGDHPLSPGSARRR